MGGHGLWQQGELGPYLPMNSGGIEARKEDILTEYLNSNFHQYQYENHGIIYISELERFFYLSIKPKTSNSGKFNKSYAVLLEIEINKLLVTYLVQDILKEKIAIFLQDIFYLDKEGQFEDIVKKFTTQNFSQLLEVPTIKEEIKMIDNVRLTRFGEITDVIAHMLDMKHIYILDDGSTQVEVILHLLNIFLGEIVDIREQMKELFFPIHLIKDYSTDYINDRVDTAVIIIPEELSIVTKLEDNIHHKELRKYGSLEIQEFILHSKGYFQQVINDYYHQIRAFTIGKKLSKPKYKQFANKMAFHDI